MPTFIRPARVTIDEGASPVAVIAGVIALAVIFSGAAALIADLITAILIITAVAVAGSLAVLVIVLRRTGVAIVQRHDAPADPEPAAVITTLQPSAISAPRTVLRVPVVPGDTTKEEAPWSTS